jgi:hypothetical protein
MISIDGLDKAAVLAALYNNSQQQGMGFLHSRGQSDMSVYQASEILATGQTYFDYLYGRLMKVDLSTNSVDPWGYDRDLGAGACARVIDSIR